MRWDAQGVSVDDGALPGLQRIGFIRSVRTPQFEGITFHEVLCKSALNKVPNARPNVAGKPAPSMLPFNYTVNAYRGCSHACRYCFARPTHEYLDLDSGTDFDSQVVVKTNVADVLRRELGPAVVAAGDGGARHQHRPVSACRGALRAHAGNHCGADRFRYALLDPDQGHAVAPRPAVDRRGRETCRRRCGGVAGRRLSRTAQGRRAGHADTPGPTRARSPPSARQAWIVTSWSPRYYRI